MNRRSFCGTWMGRNRTHSLHAQIGLKQNAVNSRLEFAIPTRSRMAVAFRAGPPGSRSWVGGGLSLLGNRSLNARNGGRRLLIAERRQQRNGRFRRRCCRMNAPAPGAGVIHLWWNISYAAELRKERNKSRRGLEKPTVRHAGKTDASASGGKFHAPGAEQYFCSPPGAVLVQYMG